MRESIDTRRIAARLSPRQPEAFGGESKWAKGMGGIKDWAKAMPRWGRERVEMA
jgi:hypothetical protein